MRLYQYVGPRQIADRTKPTPAGTPIRSAADVVQWIRNAGQRLNPEGCVIATFVVDQTGLLLIADRHSEHVACAGRQPVRSAGEITFRVSGPAIEVVAVSNQSTGYCPEPASWPAVAAAFEGAGIESPTEFTLACVFRVCPACGNRNLVKYEIFECGACGGELPVAYNCQP